jgi:apolipoprotein N-acyltransferase
MNATAAAWYRSTFGLGAVGALLLWAALPPLDLWLMAWIAPVAWVVLIQMPTLPALDVTTPQWLQSRWGRCSLLALFFTWLLLALPYCGYFHSIKYENFAMAEIVYWPVGLFILLALAVLNRRRPYLTLYLVGFYFWLAVVQWLRLPHWATSIGWWALAAYFAFFLPVFIALSRVAVHRWRVPAFLAAPIVWTGLEYVRAYLFTGMTMASLGHTQYRWTELIQISDLVGAYGVNFLVMFVAACLERLLPMADRGRAWWTVPLAACAIGGVLLYGHYRIANAVRESGPRVAIVQGSFDVQLEHVDGLSDKIAIDYYRRTVSTLDENTRSNGTRIDLVIWPETIFSPIWMTSSNNPPKPSIFQMSETEFRPWLATWVKGTRDALLEATNKLGVPMIVGVDRQHIGDHGAEFYNTAVFLQPGKPEIAWYDKMHLVLFGEYMPFVDKLPWLQNFTPLCISAHEGDRPADFVLEYKSHGTAKETVKRQVVIAPDICYESVLPHLIREQIIKLRAAGQDPDILVNLTNDGWFWGSNELEQHLACGVFRAVESRRPLLISANTGISAWIDSCGQLRDTGPRRDNKVIIANVELDHRRSFYIDTGDWFAAGCLILSLASGIAAVISSIGRNFFMRRT